MLRYCCLLLALAFGQAQATDLQPLTTEQLPTLTQQYAGQNHAQIYWSLGCAPCRQELVELGASASKQRLPISFINTGEDDPAQIQSFLAKHQLTTQEHWVFADPIPERLREAIDPQWFGELPRTYLVEANGAVHAKSGGMDIHRLLQWLVAK